jgi:hypothetical protein
MNEAYPGPGRGYQSNPGGRRHPIQADQADEANRWPEDWHRPPRGRRRPELDQTTVDQITVVDRAMVARTASLGARGHGAGRYWPLISRNWALMAGLVFFLFDTYLMVDGLASPVAVASRVLVILLWLVSVIAVGLLWLRGSSKFSVQNPFVRVKTGAHQR